MYVDCVASEVQDDLEREMAADENMPALKHHNQREFSGMLEYRKEDEMLLIRNLFLGWWMVVVYYVLFILIFFSPLQKQ